MTPQRPQIVFFGSGPVAAKSLELLSTHCDIEAVITKPQPPHHKEQFPVLAVAERLGLQTFTPFGRAELSALFMGSLAENRLQSRLGIVIDYGFIINQDVIDYFPLGIINSHFSLLPEWRGADPITFAILSSQQETGISLMLITAGMDEGPILAHAPYAIPDGTTTPQLTDALIELSDWTLQDVLPGYVSGKLTARPQDQAALSAHTATTYSRKLTKDDGILDFAKPADVLEREIRAFIEWPKSRTEIGGKPVVITAAKVVDSPLPDEATSHASSETSDASTSTQDGTGASSQGSGTTADGKTGTIWLENKRFGFVCGQGRLEISRLIPAGKREMTAEAFLAGYRHLL